jgi:hypothetical protein
MYRRDERAIGKIYCEFLHGLTDFKKTVQQPKMGT